MVISMISFLMKIKGLLLYYRTVGESGQNWWAHESPLTHRLSYLTVRSPFRCSSHNSVAFHGIQREGLTAVHQTVNGKCTEAGIGAG